MQSDIHNSGPGGSWSGHVGSHQQRVVCSGADRQYRHRPDADTCVSGLCVDSALPVGLCGRPTWELLLTEAVLRRGADAHHSPGAGCHFGLQPARPSRRLPAVGDAVRHGALPGWPWPEVHRGRDSVKSAVLRGRKLPWLGGQHVSGGWLSRIFVNKYIIGQDAGMLWRRKCFPLLRYYNCSSPGVLACGVPATCCVDPLENGTVWNSQCGVGAQQLDEFTAQSVIFLGGCLGGISRWIEQHEGLIGTVAVVVLGVQILTLFISTRLLESIQWHKAYM